MKPDINFKDEHTNRNFYNYIIRDKLLTEKTKVALTSVWFKIYATIDYIFSKDIYDYTSFHYSLVMKHYKVALQIMMYWSKLQGFELPYYLNMEGYHEFHDHPLTFFIWKNADQGVKEGSKREIVLKLLLKHTNNDLLLVKNKDGYSAYDFVLQKDYFKNNCSKKHHRKHMIDIIRKNQLKIKYLYMVDRSKELNKLGKNMKVNIAKYLA